MASQSLFSSISETVFLLFNTPLVDPPAKHIKDGAIQLKELYLSRAGSIDSGRAGSIDSGRASMSSEVTTSSTDSTRRNEGSGHIA